MVIGFTCFVNLISSRLFRWFRFVLRNSLLFFVKYFVRKSKCHVLSRRLLRKIVILFGLKLFCSQSAFVRLKMDKVGRNGICVIERRGRFLKGTLNLVD